MTPEPLAPATTLGGLPLLTDEEFLLLEPHEQDLYIRVLQADLADVEEQRPPVPNSPGEIAALVTGGVELHPKHLQLVDEAYVALDRGEIDRTPDHHGPAEVTRDEPV